MIYKNDIWIKLRLITLFRYHNRIIYIYIKKERNLVNVVKYINQADVEFGEVEVLIWVGGTVIGATDIEVGESGGTEVGPLHWFLGWTH